MSCSNDYFRECSLPTREARVRFPAGTCQSWDLYIWIEITLVKSLYNIFITSEMKWYFQAVLAIKDESHHRSSSLSFANIKILGRSSGGRWVTCWSCARCPWTTASWAAGSASGSRQGCRSGIFFGNPGVFQASYRNQSFDRTERRNIYHYFLG